MSGLLSLMPLEGYEAPGPNSFTHAAEPIFPGVPGLEWLNKYMLQAIASMVVILVFWLVMSRKNSLVPSKAQFVGETAYMFVRNSIARDSIGHDFHKYVPFLMALFSFILINNLWGIVPFTLMPTAAHISWAYGLAALVWVVYNAVGIKKHGAFGYLKHSVLPSGVPWFMWPLIIPLEFASNIIVRPATLALRLFANMFAGHLLVLVFVVGGEYLLIESPKLINKVAGGASLIFSMAIFALEIFVQCLQAFIFTVLTAVYISSAAAEEH